MASASANQDQEKDEKDDDDTDDRLEKLFRESDDDSDDRLDRLFREGDDDTGGGLGDSLKNPRRNFSSTWGQKKSASATVPPPLCTSTRPSFTTATATMMDERPGPCGAKRASLRAGGRESESERVYICSLELALGVTNVMLIKRYIYMAHAHKHGKFEVLSRPGALNTRTPGVERA